MSKSLFELPRSFGPYRLVPRERCLYRDDCPVRLGSRALEILIALMERPGELLSNEALLARVWPNLHVDHGALRVHIAALRKTLGKNPTGGQYIANDAGRGYRFTGPLVDAPDRSEARAGGNPLDGLPAPAGQIFGREATTQNLVDGLSQRRLVTITGPGGIGKTTVALAVASQLAATYPDGVRFVDLSALVDPALVSGKVASALQLQVLARDSLLDVVAALRNRRMLVVLDNCEHLIEAVAVLVEHVLAGAPSVDILTTSREPLRALGEWVHRLPPLDLPSKSPAFDAIGVMNSPAARLFVARARAANDALVLSDADTLSIAEICHRIDGIPLAIEFAAALVEVFGVQGVASQLRDSFALLTNNRRTALPRHQTLQATLEWSYQLLTREERTVFRRLSIFVGGFTLAAASAVAADGDPADVAGSLAGLVKKSLVNADVGDRTARFRLLETTRAFALAKLAESGQATAIGRRHATWYRDLAEASPNEFSQPNEFEIDNLRAALTWAFGPHGDRGIAVPLAVGSAAILLSMSLVIECHTWTEKALDAIDPVDCATRGEMVLQAALGLSLIYMGDTSNGGQVALTRAKELAESLGDFDYLLRILAGQHNLYLRLEDYRGALAVARRSVAIAEGMQDPAAATTANCILGSSLLSVGEYDEGLMYAQRSRRLAATVAQRADIVVRSGIDHSIWADCLVAHAFWQQGLLDQAAQTSHDALSVAEAGGHPVSLCFALVWCGCTVGVGRGDLETAERSTARLNDVAERHGFTAYYACSLGFAGQLAARRGNPAVAERLLRDSLDRLRRLRYEIFHTVFLGDLAEVLAALGNPDAGLVAIDEVLARDERNGGTWLLPEALRIKGEILLLSHRADVVTAEQHFLRSLDLARRQGAVSWELRSAMSLARLQHAQRRAHDAYDLLQSAYARFTEGFAAADLQSARRLLDQWTPNRGRRRTKPAARPPGSRE